MGVLAALLVLASSCSLKVPFLSSADETQTDADVAATNQPNSNTTTKTKTAQPAPNSTQLLREFENKIAEKVIDDYLKSRRNDYPGRTQYLDWDSLQQDFVHLSVANERLQHLNQKLLKEKNRNRTQQLIALQTSQQRTSKHWLELNHLNELDSLWPRLIFEPLSDSQLLSEEDFLLSTKSKLVELQQRLTMQYDAGQQYPDRLLDDAITRLDVILVNQTSSQNTDNAYLLRFQQQILYSSLSDLEKKQRFETFKTKFYEHIQPALADFRTFLISLESQSSVDKPLKLKGTFSNVDAADNKNLVTDLELNLLSIDKSISQVANNIDIEDLYKDPVYLLVDKPQPKQMVLNLLTLYINDIESVLTDWFYRRPDNDLLLVAADQLNSNLVHYNDGQVEFDLEKMTEIPDFEYESLAYQFVVPGAHMLVGWTDLHTGPSPVVDAFQLAWTQYSQTLPFENEPFYAEELSRIGYLVRYKRFVANALVDLKLYTGEWSVTEAETFLSAQLPYTEADIQTDITSILRHPGQHIEAWQLAALITSTITDVTNEGQISLQEAHQTLFRNSPLDLATLQSIRESLLERSQKSLKSRSN